MSNMKRKILYLIVAILFLLCPKGAVHAEEITDPSQYTLEESREAPAYKIIPPPTPTPQITIPEDKRSWTRSKYKEIIQSVSVKYNLDPQLIHATIMTESEGRENAYRYEPRLNDASLCLGQILTSTARYLGYTGNIKDIYKPEVCIDLIGRYHRKMLDTYGELNSTQLAIAYNAGSPWKRPVYGHITRFQKWFNEQAV